MLFRHESVSGTESPTSSGDSYQKTTHISLSTEAMPLALGVLSPGSHGLGWLQIFLKGTVIPISFLWSSDISPVQIGCHIPRLLRRWKRPFAGGPACCATASWVQTALPMAVKLGIPLHPMGTMSLASLSSLERSASLSSSTSLFPLILWHKFRLWTVRQTAFRGVGYRCPQKNVLPKKSSDWNRNRNRNLSPKIIIQDPSSVIDVQPFSLLSTIPSLQQPSSYIQDFIEYFPFHVIPIFTYLSLCTFHGHHLIEPGSSLALGNTQQLLGSRKGSGTRVNLIETIDERYILLLSL